MSESTNQIISAAQKQALINNLRLEVTDRARTLRNQYATLASSLQSRIELRVNRIPRALRTQTMGDLIEQYSESLEVARPRSIMPLGETLYGSSANLTALNKFQLMSKKRTSGEMILGSDKENAQVQPIDETLPVQKKRKLPGETMPSVYAAVPRSGTTASSSLARQPSKKINPSQVLSPKSNNSRTYPYSPIRPPVPSKSGQRPASPTKPDQYTMAPLARVPGKQPATGRTISKVTASSLTAGASRGKKPAMTASGAIGSRTRAASSSSENSTTTIITKSTAQVAKKVGIMSKVAGIASAAGRKKVTVASTTVAKGKKVEQADTGTVRRGLRTRKLG